MSGEWAAKTLQIVWTQNHSSFLTKHHSEYKKQASYSILTEHGNSSLHNQ
jgi:hypothetical protein